MGGGPQFREGVTMCLPPHPGSFRAFVADSEEEEEGAGGGSALLRRRERTVEEKVRGGWGRFGGVLGAGVSRN